MYSKEIHATQNYFLLPLKKALELVLILREMKVKKRSSQSNNRG